MENPFEGELQYDLYGEQIDAYNQDGQLIKARIRIGSPYCNPSSNSWKIRSEIVDVDYADGPLQATTSFSAMVIAIDWIDGRMKILREKHGYEFYYPGTKEEYHVRQKA